jgi:hypothetical protein
MVLLVEGEIADINLFGVRSQGGGGLIRKHRLRRFLLEQRHRTRRA